MGLNARFGQRSGESVQTKPAVAIVMGSQSDWPTMRLAAETLETLEIEYEARIISAHRTPERMVDFASNARADGFRI
ncbi:MAG TPA: AIR carboxylase family protein, partial [Devosia sp.]|nr:AIR carboxylase family protein [Devosia sp.]